MDFATRPKLLSSGTILAAATVVVASVAGSLFGSSSDAAPLVLCAAAYLAVLVVGGRIVERRGRGHIPLVVLLLLLGAAAVGIGNAAATLILMPLISITVIFYSATWGMLLTALLTGWVVVVLARSHQGLRQVLEGAASFVAAGLFVVIFSRLVVKERAASLRIERLAAEVEAKNRTLQSYAERVEELATAQERSRIAREIHDGLGHYLTGAHVHLEAARALMGDEDAGVLSHVVRAQKLLQEGLSEVRQAVALLRSPVADRPFAASIGALIDDARASGITAKLHIGGAVRPLGSAVEFVLYRVVQEALTNVRRHARAEKVDLRIRYDDVSVELRIEDDGIGAVDPHAGFGLVGVRERVALVGGEMDVATAASGGFALCVRVPA